MVWLPPGVADPLPKERGEKVVRQYLLPHNNIDLVGIVNSDYCMVTLILSMGHANYSYTFKFGHQMFISKELVTQLHMLSALTIHYTTAHAQYSFYLVTVSCPRNQKVTLACSMF